MRKIIIGGIAALIAVLGIYGVTTYSAQQRERELAIRVALGAAPSAIAILLLRESGVVLAAGLLIGLVGSVNAARMLEHQVFAVQPFDVWTLGAAAALMSVVWLAATWGPACRASRKDPAAGARDGLAG